MLQQQPNACQSWVHDNCDVEFIIQRMIVTAAILRVSQITKDQWPDTIDSCPTSKHPPGIYCMFSWVWECSLGISWLLYRIEGTEHLPHRVNSMVILSLNRIFATIWIVSCFVRGSVAHCILTWSSLLGYSWCFKPSQPKRIISGLRETFVEKYIAERTSKAEIRPKEQSEKAENEIQLKGP